MKTHLYTKVAVLALTLHSNAWSDSDTPIRQVDTFLTGDSIELIGSDKDKKAILNAGHQIGSLYYQGTLTGTLSESGTSTLADRDGLRTDSALAVSATKLFLTHRDVAIHPGIFAQQSKIEAAKQLLKACKATLLKGAVTSDEDKMCSEEQALLDKLLLPQTLDNSYSALIKYQYLKFSAEVNDTKFKHFDQTNLKNISGSEEGYKASVVFGWVPESKSAVREIGFEYQSGYAFAGTNREKNICMPVAATTLTECFNTRLAPAIKTERLVPYFQVKKRFDEGLVNAISIKLSYISEEKGNEDDDKWAVEVPVYLFSDQKNGFNGGISLSYLSEVDEDTDKLGVSLFLGTTFDLYAL